MIGSVLGRRPVAAATALAMAAAPTTGGSPTPRAPNGPLSEGTSTGILLHNGVLDPLFAVLIYRLAAGAGPIARVLSWRPLVVLGEASYSIYILQSPVCIGMKGAVALAAFGSVLGGGSLNRSPLFAFAYCLVLIGVSVATLYWYEMPARQAVKRFFAGRRLLVVERPAAASS